MKDLRNFADFRDFADLRDSRVSAVGDIHWLAFTKCQYIIYYAHYRPGAVAESVEHWSCLRDIVTRAIET